MGSDEKPTKPGQAPGSAPGGGSAPAKNKAQGSAGGAAGNNYGKSRAGSEISTLGSLREAPTGERPELFKKKLQACSFMYDFNSNVDDKEKELKRQTLLEIVEYVNNTRNCFNETIMADVVEMVSKNIFRTLPPTRTNINAIYDPEEDEPMLECSWPHLQIVYEFFLRFVVSNDVDPKIAKRQIDQKFVLKLLDLFDSEDPRERDYLKTILHRIYGKFMALRATIRKYIQNFFFKVIYETDYHNGIAELLEILGSIINGFALPLKDEHKNFLDKSLIPLHKVKTLNSFHQQLSYCMTQYVEKDPKLAIHILTGILKFCPVTNTPKEVLFLNEAEEILELTQGSEFTIMMLPLFYRISNCIISPHFQVAERTLFLWNNDYIVKHINFNRDKLFSIISGALYTNSKNHWNSTVHGLTYNVLKLLMEADPSLFDECSIEHRKQEEEVTKHDTRRVTNWTKLIQDYNAAHSEKGWVEPVLEGAM